MNKLEALRVFMKSEGLSALLIPRMDEFQGEYIAPYSERLKWLTSFSGSAGFAVLTQDKAAFFTDGRYMLQAKEEIPSFYELHNVAQKTPSQWISENLSPPEKVGYDPWLFTEAQLQRYDRPLIPLKTNPIDLLWEDRPSPFHEIIRLHPLKYAGESDRSKRKRIGAFLKADHVLITACDSIAWLLNIRGNDVPHTPIVHSVCLLRQDGSYDFFVDLNKINGEVFHYIHQDGGRAIDIHEGLRHLKKLEGSCQIDPQTTPVIMIQTLEEAGIKIVREKDPCLLPKAIKNEIELKGAMDAHIQDGIALCQFFAWLEDQPLKGETTELSAAQKLCELRKKGTFFEDLSFDTISGFGPHGAVIHYRVTPESDVPLERNGLYLVDSGGQYLNGTTDVTRTIALGIPTAEQKDRYTRVLKGHIALAQAVFPEGTTGAQLDALARQFLWHIGCDYDHGTGHGVGSYLSVHEGPQGISKRASDVPLKPGMILSNEPGYYKEGNYGIRIENLVRVIEIPNLNGFYGFETMTLAPLDLKLISEALLTDNEKTWIKIYHQRIFKTLTPYHDLFMKEWWKNFLLKLLSVAPMLAIFVVMVGLMTTPSSWAMGEEKKELFPHLPQPLIKASVEKEEEPPTPISVLPREMFLYIFSFLRPQELASLALVSGEWKETSEQDCLWKPYGMPSKKEYMDLYKKEHVFRQVTEIMKGNKPFYTHYYIDPYYLPDAVIVRGTRNFDLAEGQSNYLENIVFLTVQKTFANLFKVTSEDIRKVIKCIALQAFEKNGHDDDRYVYTSSSFSKVQYGHPLILISDPKSLEEAINRFVKDIVETRKNTINALPTPNSSS